MVNSIDTKEMHKKDKLRKNTLQGIEQMLFDNNQL